MIPKMELVKIIQGIVGPDRVTADDYACWAVMQDLGAENPPASELVGPPDLVVRPQTMEQVSRIVKLANRYMIPIVPAGCKGHPTAGAMPTQGGILMDMLDMNKIVGIDEDSMIATVEAGCLWETLRGELAKMGYTTGGLGPHGPGGTVGGAVATGTVPLNITKYGFIHEEIEALEVVLPNGDVIWTGSRSNAACDFALRNVNGPDLTGLFCGSHGALGVITKVSLRIYPKPKWTIRDAYAFNDYEKGLRAIREFQLTKWISDIIALIGMHTIGPFCPVAPPDTEILVPIILEEEWDERIIKTKKEVCDNIAKKYGGVALGSDAAWFAYNRFKQNYLPGLSLGGAMEIIGLKPTLYALRDKKMLEEMAAKYEPKLRTPFEMFVGTPLEKWRAWFRTMHCYKHPNCVDDVLFMYWEPSDLELSKELLAEAHKCSDMMIDKGCAAYWIGHGKSLGLARNWIPEYYEALRAIKRVLDPNNIMNPGMFRL